MQEQIQDRITYSDSELPIPTFHCRCGYSTEGFSLCLKCHPQTYTVRQDLVQNFNFMKPSDDVNVYAKEVWNAAIEEAAKVADIACRFITAGEIRKLKK